MKMHDIAGSEAFISRDEKLFRRTIEEMPMRRPKGVSFWAWLVIIAMFAATAVTAYGTIFDKGIQ
jgi:hypothetical protein